jgi:hypothetical protein
MHRVVEGTRHSRSRSRGGAGSSDVIVVRIFLTNTGGEEGEAQERARMSYRKSAEIVLGCGDGCQKSSWRGVVTRGTIERRW